ncbi:MAG: DNA internalization-related competence protein ComEC/Rec2 [Anaerolineae bacterium]
MTLIYLGCAWLAGICLGSLLRPPPGLLWSLTLLPLAGLLLWRREPQPRLLSACTLALLLGALRFSATVPHFNQSSLAFYNDKGPVTLQGLVAGEPDVRDRWTNLRVAARRLKVVASARSGDKWSRGSQVRAERIRDERDRLSGLEPNTSCGDWAASACEDEDWIEVRGMVLVHAPRYPAYSYGDELEIEGKLETPPQFADFSYRDYLARQGVYSLLRRPRITLLARGKGNPFYAALYAFKGRAQAVIAAILPEPQASLLTGILLGVERGIPAQVMEQFNATSTSHVIAISGFNISILAGMLSRVGRHLLGRRRSAYFAVAGIVVYTILVGAYASVVRAAIMGCLYVIATHYGRQGDALTSLVVAAVLMTLAQPLVLWDVGFQLSFAATLGLILYTPLVHGGLTRLLAKGMGGERAQQVAGLLNEVFTVTLVAQFMTLPIIVYNFRRLSLISLPANFLILAAQPGVMVWGGLATLLGLIYLPLGRIVGWVAWLFLTYTLRIVELTAQVPHASLEVGRPSLALVGLYYGLLMGGLALIQRGTTPLRTMGQRLTRGLSTKAALLALAAITLLVWSAALATPDGWLHVVFFDVGQGDAIFVQTPGGHQVLIDGGPDPSALLAQLGRYMPFWDRSLDLVVMTHPDADHFAGLVPALERYRVGQVLETGLADDTALYRQWEETVEARHIPVVHARAGMRLGLGHGVWAEVFNPTEEILAHAQARDNDTSIVLRLTWGEVSVLLTGDIEAGAEGRLVASGAPLRSTVLKVSHHGSGNATTHRFVEAVDPQVAVIQVGADNRFGHPAPEVLERLVGTRVFRTDRHGTIEVVTDGVRCWVRTER